jgi:sialic acid synthase
MIPLKTPNQIGLSSNNRVFFIAEAGINHNGEIEKAKQLIDLAKRAGADAVKFQKRTINRILTKEGLEKPYNTPNSFGENYGKHKEFLELSFDQFRELKNYADEKEIMFVASGWDEESVDFLDTLGVPFFKMASADLTNFPLLEHTAKKQKPMIISTGMADLKTVEKAYELVRRINPNVAILQCTSSYPTPNNNIHLNVIRTYQREFPQAVIGYSGHETGTTISLGAVALGAKIVERHFTLDNNMKGGDHKASLEEKELTYLVNEIRLLEDALGGDKKEIQEGEEKCFLKLAKSLVSTKEIKKGEQITTDMLTTKGPGSGISPMDMEKIIGLTALKDIEEDIVLYEDFFGL